MATGYPPVTKTTETDLQRLILLEPPQVVRETDGRQTPPMHQPQLSGPVVSKEMGKEV